MASTINASTSPAAIVQTADGTGILALQTANTTAVTIDASQRVGIGTASPTGKLQVSGAGGVSGSTNLVYVDVTSSYGGISLNSTANNNTFVELLEAGTKVGGFNADTTNNVTSIQSAGGHALGFNYNNTTEAMRIDSSGNIDIGYVPTTTVQKVNINCGSGDGIGFNTNPTYTNWQTAKIAAIDEGASFKGTLAFYTAASSATPNAATERMRIDSSGFTYINCTSSVGAAPAYSNIAFNGVSYYGLAIKTSYSSVGSGFAVFINSAGTQQGSIYANTTSSTQFLTSSDYRLKENIAPMIGALDTVAQLKPVTYKWKLDGSASQGFIAHELQAIVPDCVSGEKDAVETYTDEEGNEQTRIKPQGVDTSFLVATLTAAIQEQQALITSLTARKTALEGA